MADKVDWRETRRRLLEKADCCRAQGMTGYAETCQEHADAIKAAHIDATEEAFRIIDGSGSQGWALLRDRLRDLKSGKVEFVEDWCEHCDRREVVQYHQNGNAYHSWETGEGEHLTYNETACRRQS
jgi:hypothetical protein